MRRIVPEDLRIIIAVQLTTMPGWQRRKAQIGDERAIKDVVDRLMERIFTGAWVIVPDQVQDVMHTRPGKFGETEPYPCPPAPIAPPPPGT